MHLPVIRYAPAVQAAPQIGQPLRLFIVESQSTFDHLNTAESDTVAQSRQRSFAGLSARMVQHEYDHLDGRLYLDHLSALQKKLLGHKLENIRKGRYRASYPMK